MFAASEPPVAHSDGLLEKGGTRDEESACLYLRSGSAYLDPGKSLLGLVPEDSVAQVRV